MDLSSHNLEGLFAQLGLDATDSGIKTFINKHKGLDANTNLADASFWNNSQASFLSDALQLDSDWSEIVDVLNTLLR
ncbi:DUF2789 domain-containing protein [Thalassotalea nanhaiensis]|uniref:DUF2789 domain-containing protein n=1 Tax=Thalassotalea nanhaiensis TaxID=3065648 RepID=A0ABY9TEG8_9GAMM|nr:DUF2789 domain-containing protein [Colwelliaceae bacterium SQ345]